MPKETPRPTPEGSASVSTDKLLSPILDSIGEGVFTVDNSFRITTFNAAAEALTGIRRQDAIGMKCRDVFKADICQRDCALRHTMENNEPRREVRVNILDSRMREVPVRVSTAVLHDQDGAVLGGVEIMRDISELEALRQELNDKVVFQNIVGVSRPMRNLFRILPDVSCSDVPVLITGASGTGKELFAQALHKLSPRSEAPFIKVNCGALPDSLLESELFGHQKGAFTDARSRRRGRFQAANGGTLLLDEIGETSQAFQVKLLRVLQDGEIFPLGSSTPIKVDVRLISATNRDLESMVREGTFRQDLFYRLRVVTLEIPPLRERRQDIPALIDHLLKRISTRRGRQVKGLTPAAHRALASYDFPGNIRELENILERAMVLCHSPDIGVEHLPPEVFSPVQPPMPGAQPQHPAPSPSFPGSTQPAPIHGTPQFASESERLLWALNTCGWNRQKTARYLGISRSTLWRQMKRFRLIP